MNGQHRPILFCMDVRKLYPSVPKTEGIEACRRALETREDKSIPTEEVIKIKELVLENNNFGLDNTHHFVQREGMAIGSRLGRNYACRYMGSWEELLLDGYPTKPLVYFRFCDDIFGCWQGGEDSLKRFHDYANSIHPKIQVDLRMSTSSIEFLDE